MGRTFEALDQSMRFTLTPEEHQVLGLTEEDVASFSDPGIALTPVEIDNAIVEIIASAYNESPVFKKLVDEDAAKDPTRLGRSSKVVSKFLKHLRGVLPPETRAAIKTDTFDQAHEMVRGVLYNKLNKPAAPPVVEEKIEPITDSELSLFNIPRASLTAKTTWWDIKDNVLFFLGKLTGADGKTVKNESTKKMPDDLKIQVLGKLFNDIRQKKLEASGGKLSPSDEKFVGKDIRQLKIMARSMVVPSPGKPGPVYQNDLMEVNSQIGEALKMMDRVQEISKDTKFTAAINDLTQALDTALPPVSLFEDRVKGIQEEISKLGLTKPQVMALTEVDPNSLTYGDPIKKLLEDQKMVLQAIQKDIKDKGETPEIDIKRKNILGQIKQLEDLSAKDTSGLKGAIEDYLSTLRAYKENINKNISEKKLDSQQQKKLTEFIAMVNQMALTFSRLTREELFKARWAGRSGFLMRSDKPKVEPPPAESQSEPTPAVPVNKMAGDAAGYASKLETFRGKGLGDAYNEIQDIIEDDSKLPAIKGKLIDIIGFKDRIEAVGNIFDTKSDPKKTHQQIKKEVYDLIQGTVYGPQIAEILNKTDDLEKLQQVITTILKKDVTVQSQSEGVSHADIGLGDAVKLVNRLRSLLKKIDIQDKGTEALEILQWAASLQNHIKTGKAKAPSGEKLASAACYLRRLAMRLLGAEETTVHKTYQSPAGVGSETPLRSPGKARPILYRERMTKMGKKALQSIFEEPTFVPDFVEEMEKAGLNRMLVHGGEISEMDIEPILDEVLQKVTGKTGNLENILMTKTMQAFNTEFSIGKTKKELEESRTRVKELNAKISETEDKYLPKLEEFAEFIKDPINATREQMDDLRWNGREKSKKEDTGTSGTTQDVKPEEVTPENYRSVLRRLADRYIPKGSGSQDTEFTKSRFKQAKDVEKKSPTDLSKMLPSEFIKQYMVWKKQLKNVKANVDHEQDSYKKAVGLEKYYAFMKVVAKNISDYLEYQGKVIKADEIMIKDVEAFLSSEAAKEEKEQFIQESRALLGRLKGAFAPQKKFFDNLHAAHSDIGSVIDLVDDQLKTIQDDISDKKVDLVYQVAISPDLVPSKDIAREIKERAKEHEKGLAYIIDRSTYKNNMNRLMTFKMKHGPFKSYPGEGVKILDPERKKDLENTLRAFEERVRRMKQIAESGMREIALKKLEDDLAKAKATVESGSKLIEEYTALVENIDFLDANKATMDPVEYGKQVAGLNNLLKAMHIYQEESSNDVKAKKADLKRDIKNETAFLERVHEHINQLEGGAIDKARKEFETNRPPVDVPKQVELMLQKLYRLRGMDQSGSLKARPLQEQISVTEDKINQIKELSKVPVNAAPGTPGEQAYNKFKKELEHILEVATRDLEDLKKNQGSAQSGVPMAKTAAQGDPTGDEGKSTFDKALDKKGIKPAPYMQELPKPKGWDIVENFFNEVKREHRLIKDLKERGQSSNIQTKYLKKRMDQLENMAEAIDMYKNQKVTIGGDPVAFRDVMTEFEKTLSDYQDILAKYTNQRDASVDKVAYLQQELDHYNEMYDENTGEFKGLDPEEIANLKGIFLRMLYKDLERYWGTKVGKDLSVFGERDTNWYNNVFMTFKKVAQTRSNKKMLGIINKYKQETRSDFDDMTNRFKSQQLEKERDQLMEGYKEYGVDPEISSRLKEFNMRIETLKKQEKQMDRIFNFMGTASIVAMQADFEKMLREKAQEMAATAKSDETLKPSKANLEDKADKSVDEAFKAVEEELPVIAEHARESELAEKELEELKGITEERGTPIPAEKPVEPSVGKMAFDKNHRDFNLSILYGPFMQSKIAEMLSEEMK
jgi:hypothetical protein